jgi:hypothetical protein
MARSRVGATAKKFESMCGGSYDYPIQKTTHPVVETPGSPHSKQKTPFNPQFQSSRPFPLHRSTDGDPFWNPLPQAHSARFTPQQAEDSF